MPPMLLGAVCAEIDIAARPTIRAKIDRWKRKNFFIISLIFSIR
jgi:hypothetical protein